MKRKYLCDKHNYIIKELTSVQNDISLVLKQDRDDIEILLETLEDIDNILYDIIYEIEEAQECGEKMEARLCKYREAIEDLGFIRESYKRL